MTGRNARWLQQSFQETQAGDYDGIRGGGWQRQQGEVHLPIGEDEKRRSADDGSDEKELLFLTPWDFDAEQRMAERTGFCDIKALNGCGKQAS